MTYTVAIVGAGIGGEHMGGYLALPDRFQVRWVCDLDAGRGQALAARAPGTRWTVRMDEVLADPGVQIVDICLPPHLHFSAAMQALAAGKHVVCEKPLVASLAEADRLAEAAQAAGRQVFPVFQYRYGTGAAQLKALIAAGLTGRVMVGTLETHWDRPASYYDISWRGTWAGERGGAILGHAIHIHDMLTAFVGPLETIYAALATRVNAIEVEDCAALAIRTADGAVVTSSVTLGAADNTSRLRLVYEGVTVESDHAPYAPAAKPWTFRARAPRTEAEIDAVLATIGEEPARFHGLFAAMAEALDGRPGSEVTLADGRRSLEFVTAVYASARSGLAVALPIGPEHPLYAGWMP